MHVARALGATAAVGLASVVVLKLLAAVVFPVVAMLFGFAATAFKIALIALVAMLAYRMYRKCRDGACGDVGT